MTINECYNNFMSNDDSQKQLFQGIEIPDSDVIKGSYQVITPNPPPDPVGGNWGTATPSGAPSSDRQTSSDK